MYNFLDFSCTCRFYIWDFVSFATFSSILKILKSHDESKSIKPSYNNYLESVITHSLTCLSLFDGFTIYFKIFGVVDQLLIYYMLRAISGLYWSCVKLF